MGVNEFINVGARIKEARTKKGYTQKEMAEKLKIPKSTYSNYENSHREPSSTIIKSIASILEMDVRELFNSQDNNKKNLNAMEDFLGNNLIHLFFNDSTTKETINDYYNLISYWQRLINIKPKKLNDVEKEMLSIGQRYIDCFKILLIILGKTEMSNLNDFVLSEILLSKQFDSMLDYTYYLAINNDLEEISTFDRRKTENKIANNKVGE